MSKSILQSETDKECYLCRILHDEEFKGYLEEHHVMFGPDRGKSEHFGLKVYLCVAHHRLGKEAVHISKETNVLLRQIAQVKFERKYGAKKWMSEFGKNYLNDEMRERYLGGR